MKTETILDAMEKAHIHISDSDLAFNPNLIDLYAKRRRQYRAFRDRILRQYEEEETWHIYYSNLCAEKDTRIAELEAELRAFNRPFDDPSGRYELTNEEWSKP